MRLIHDVDVIVLMATTLASKRRPAELSEIVAAADLLQGFAPSAEKLGEAIQHLSILGLIGATEGGFTLTASGQEIMAGQPKKATTEELVSAIQAKLASYRPKEKAAAILLAEAELVAAIRAHKLSRKSPVKNLLMPKPKPDRHFKVQGRWRRASPTR